VLDPFIPTSVKCRLDEQDVFESDFASTDEEADRQTEETGEAEVVQEERRIRKVGFFDFGLIATDRAIQGEQKSLRKSDSSRACQAASHIQRGYSTINISEV